MINIRGMTIHFGVETINKVYGLPNSGYSKFTTKDCALGSWLAYKLYLGKNVPRATSKSGITSKEFTT